VGQKLLKFYEILRTEGGMPVQMRLAIRTNMPSPAAEKAPDSPENILKFKEAFKEITGKDAPIN